jgi:hypothetical protein
MNPVKTPTQLRLTHDLLERADALIAVMAADPEVRALGMPTRTAVLRLAIARGLRDLERQYQPTADASAPRSITTPHEAPRPITTPHDVTPPSREGTLSHMYAGRDGENQEPRARRTGSGVSTPAPKGS